MKNAQITDRTVAALSEIEKSWGRFMETLPAELRASKGTRFNQPLMISIAVAIFSMALDGKTRNSMTTTELLMSATMSATLLEEVDGQIHDWQSKIDATLTAEDDAINPDDIPDAITITLDPEPVSIIRDFGKSIADQHPQEAHLLSDAVIVEAALRAAALLATPATFIETGGNPAMILGAAFSIAMSRAARDARPFNADEAGEEN